MLAGAVHVHGYTLTPSNAYHCLVSPTNWGRSVIGAADQTLRQREQNGTVVFVNVSDEKQGGRIPLDLPLDEIKVRSPWQKLCMCVCVPACAVWERGHKSIGKPLNS